MKISLNFAWKINIFYHDSNFESSYKKIKYAHLFEFHRYLRIEDEAFTSVSKHEPNTKPTNPFPIDD